jgi:hypothetical protein
MWMSYSRVEIILISPSKKFEGECQPRLLHLKHLTARTPFLTTGPVSLLKNASLNSSTHRRFHNMGLLLWLEFVKPIRESSHVVGWGAWRDIAA